MPTPTSCLASRTRQVGEAAVTWGLRLLGPAGSTLAEYRRKARQSAALRCGGFGARQSMWGRSGQEERLFAYRYPGSRLRPFWEGWDFLSEKRRSLFGVIHLATR